MLDASVTVSWFIPDEQASITQGILRQVVEQGAVVPLLWPLEVANALTMAVRRGRISSLQRSDALRQLAALQLSSDDQTLNEAWGRTLDLADRFRLTVYDACYLELGCGVGIGALLTAAANPGWQVTAIDYNPAHIAIGMSLARAARLDNIRFLEADITQLA